MYSFSAEFVQKNENFNPNYLKFLKNNHAKNRSSTPSLQTPRKIHSIGLAVQKLWHSKYQMVILVILHRKTAWFRRGARNYSRVRAALALAHIQFLTFVELECTREFAKIVWKTRRTCEDSKEFLAPRIPNIMIMNLEMLDWSDYRTVLLVWLSMIIKFPCKFEQCLSLRSRVIERTNEQTNKRKYGPRTLDTGW